MILHCNFPIKKIKNIKKVSSIKHDQTTHVKHDFSAASMFPRPMPQKVTWPLSACWKQSAKPASLGKVLPEPPARQEALLGRHGNHRDIMEILKYLDL